MLLLLQTCSYYKQLSGKKLSIFIKHQVSCRGEDGDMLMN